jgi:hypothetical protein
MRGLLVCELDDSAVFGLGGEDRLRSHYVCRPPAHDWHCGVGLGTHSGGLNVGEEEMDYGTKGQR